MGKIKQAPQRAEFPKLEDRIIEYWKENDTFKKSVEQRSEDNPYVFVDGPPFVSGMPHYGHLMVSVCKDVVPRFWAMKGKRVRRVWGWDCHGLPIEAKVNQKHNLTGRDQIENEFGVDRYMAECRKYVTGHIEAWKWYISKIGRWVDIDNAYSTMNPEFSESVIWGFKQMWDKGLVYKGKRVSLYSTDTATPVSNFEVNMDPDNYAETEDLSVYVKFELEKTLVEGMPTYMVAWTTTPWTIPSNFALAVNPDVEYAVVQVATKEDPEVFEDQALVFAKDLLEDALGMDGKNQVRGHKILKTMKGSEFDQLDYKPVYDYFVQEKTENDYKVYSFDEVSDSDGSGILHIAPAFGEVDFNFGKDKGLSFHSDIDAEGNLIVGDFKGAYLRDACVDLTKQMAGMGNLYRSKKYKHRLPYYRGDNPLIYMAQDSYFIDIQSQKEAMHKHNQEVNWVPSHFKEGRFAHTIETAPDWGISRNRYWATIMPLWVSEDGAQLVVGSFDEMMEYTDQLVKVESENADEPSKYTMDGVEVSLHRDFMDKIVLIKDGKEFKRVPEVLDVWMDSGSVPFAEYGYPFRNKESFEKFAPADFIVEYTGQIRAWFNVLHRISTMIFDRPAFKNVLCHGTLAGNDGRKMSKTYGNYPDPKEVLETIGGEAVRLYFMSCPIFAGGDMNWSDDELNEQVKTVMIPLWNTYRYLTMYAEQFDWTPTDAKFTGETELDRWLESFVNKATVDYDKHMTAYELPQATRLIQPTLEGISTWYIRRSRDRFAAGDVNAMQNLYAALIQVIKTFAPQMAFLTEEIYQNLVVDVLEGQPESVHLCDYPEVTGYDEDLLKAMRDLQMLSSKGLKQRVDNQIKLRQPIAKVTVNDESLTEGSLEILKEELNAKSVVVDKSQEQEIVLDLELTPELILEGAENEVVRALQSLRAKNGLEVGEESTVQLCVNDTQLKDYLDSRSEEIYTTTTLRLEFIEELEDEKSTDAKTTFGVVKLMLK